MAQSTKTNILAQFEAGDRPTDQTFIDLFDSIVFLGTSNINGLGSVTSLSGDVTLTDDLTVDGNLSFGGNLLVGNTTETSVNPLQVYTSANETVIFASGSQSDIMFEGVSADSTSSIKLSDNINNIRFGTHTGKAFFEVAGNEILNISSSNGTHSNRVFISGSIGLGIAEPSTDIHIKNVNDGAITLESDGTNSSALFKILNDAHQFDLGVDTNDQFKIINRGTLASPSTTTPVIIDTDATTNNLVLKNGKVGIGTDAPGATLDVRGDIVLGSTPSIRIYDDNDVSSVPDIDFTADALLAASGSFNINIDSDNNTTNAKFSVRRDSGTNAGQEVFRVTEAGAVSASSYTGDGSGLSGITSTQIDLFGGGPAENELVTVNSAGTGLDAESQLTFNGEKFSFTLLSGNTNEDGIQILSPSNNGKLLFINNVSDSGEFYPHIKGHVSDGLASSGIAGLIIEGEPATDNINNPGIILRVKDAADESPAENSPILRAVNFNEHKFQIGHDGSVYVGDPTANTPDLVGGFNLQIRGGTGTIAGSTGGTTNLTGSSFLVGSTESGIGIDSNEIYRHGGSLSIGTLDSSDIIYYQNGAETVRFKQDGKVGIGKSSPQAGLHIDISSIPQLLLDGGGASTGDIVVPTGEILEIGHWDNSSTTFTDRFNIQSDGSIGIGVVSPSYFFDVQTTEDTIAHFKSTDAGPSYIRINTSAADSDTHSGIIYQENGSNKVFSGYSATNDTAVFVYDTGPNSSDGININSSGKVGIGTVSPDTQKLHIFDDSTVDIGDNSNKGQLTLENDGDGDVGITYLLTGLQRWSTYINNSNNDDFVIECTTTDTRGLIVETDGDVTVGKDLDVTGTLSLGNGSIVFDTTGTFGPEIRFVGNTDAGFIGYDSVGDSTGETILRIGTRDNENEPIVLSQQSTDAIIDERMRVDTGGDIIMANSLMLGLTGNQDGVSPYDETSTNGGKPALVIKSKYQGGDIESSGTEGNPQDGFAGGGIRLVDNDTTNYWDNAYINNTLVWSYRDSSTATVQFRATEDNEEETIAFTGQHPCRPKTNIESFSSKIGYIVVANGSYNNGKFSTNVTSTTEPTINEALPEVVLSNAEKDKKVFGVISLVEDSNTVREVTHGKITSILAPAKQAAGDERLWINSLGEGAIMVSNYNGNIENGDYITTSPIEGIGMKQDDDLLHNYTVAKITQDEDFSSGTTDITHNGQTYKFKLVGCTYHCG